MKKFFKSKIVKYCITGVITVIIIISIIAASSSCSSCSCSDEDTVKIDAKTAQTQVFRPKDTVTYLQPSYKQNGFMFFAFNSQKTSEIEKVTYSIDNQEEIELNNTSAKTNQENEYYFEGMPEGVIFTSDFSEGTHIINFYVYQKGVKKEALSKTFKIIGTSSSSVVPVETT